MDLNTEVFDDDGHIPIVQLEDGRLGIVKSLGAHASRILVEEDMGHDFEEIVPNEDFEILGYIKVEKEEE